MLPEVSRTAVHNTYILPYYLSSAGPMLIVLCWVQHKEEQYTASMGQKDKSCKGSDLHAAAAVFK